MITDWIAQVDRAGHDDWQDDYQDDQTNDYRHSNFNQRWNARWNQSSKRTAQDDGSTDNDGPDDCTGIVDSLAWQVLVLVDFTITRHQEDTVVNPQGNQHNEAKEWCIPSQHAAVHEDADQPVVD